MPQDSTHPDYDDMLPVWEMIDTALKGRRAVLASAKAFIPELAEQSPAEYEAYSKRAIWVGYTNKTAAGWVGIVTRKPPNVTTPESMAAFLANCDKQGSPFSAYVGTVVRDLVESSRCGTLIDWDATGSAYVRHYDKTQIINWDTVAVEEQTRLSFLMLKETSSQWVPGTGDPVPDPYVRAEYPQWREYRLLDAATSPKVEMKVWRRKVKAAITKGATGTQRSGNRKAIAPQLPDDKAEFVLIQSATLTRRGQGLPMIPFVFHTAANSPPECVAKPMLEDIAELNFDHLRMSADLQNGRHVAGLPTPWAKKFTDPDKPVRLTLGTSAAWTSDDENAECGMLEMTGAALKTIAEGMAEVEKQMAALGAQAIEGPKKDAEAVGTVALRQRAETASLVSLAEQSSRSLSLVLQWVYWLKSTDKLPQDKANEVYIVIPSNMTSGRMPAEELTALTTSLTTGGISFDTFFHLLKQGEMYPDDRTLEEERDAIEAGAPQPPLPPQPEPAPGSGGFGA